MKNEGDNWKEQEGKYEKKITNQIPKANFSLIEGDGPV